MPTVRGELRRHFRDSGWVIRVPRRVQQMQARIKDAQHQLEAQLGRSPRPSEVAAHLGVEVDGVVEALAADGCFRPASIDSKGDAQERGTIADVLGHDDRGFATLEARLVLDTAVGRLSDRERLILRWRFEDERTQQEIADLLGLTKGLDRRRRNVVLRGRDTHDYTYTDWIYGPAALTPDQEPPHYPVFPLSSVEVGEPAAV